VALKIIFESDGGKSLGGAENQENRLLVRQSLKRF
jgi:hypothetical protein